MTKKGKAGGFFLPDCAERRKQKNKEGFVPIQSAFKRPPSIKRADDTMLPSCPPLGAYPPGSGTTPVVLRIEAPVEWGGTVDVQENIIPSGWPSGALRGGRGTAVGVPLGHGCGRTTPHARCPSCKSVDLCLCVTLSAAQ